MIRAIILSATIAALFCLWLDKPIPVKYTSADYCMISFKAVAKDMLGRDHIVWTQGWGPCSQLDRYENI